MAGYPLDRENRENGPKNVCQEKHRECGNCAKTQEVWFARVVNSLILRVKDISIFVAKISDSFLKLDELLASQFCVCNSQKSHELAWGKFAVGQGINKGKHRVFENAINEPICYTGTLWGNRRSLSGSLSISEHLRAFRSDRERA